MKFWYLDVGIRSFSNVYRMLEVLHNRHIIGDFKSFSVRMYNSQKLDYIEFEETTITTTDKPLDKGFS